MINRELERLLLENVALIHFVKKTGENRSMLCTINQKMLNSVEGKAWMHYYNPQNPPPYNPEPYNNLIVWDIQREAFRQINCNTVQIKQMVSAERYLETARKHPSIGQGNIITNFLSLFYKNK